eukprot:734416-Prorocentrum_minimum.AAC.1
MPQRFTGIHRDLQRFTAVYSDLQRCQCGTSDRSRTTACSFLTLRMTEDGARTTQPADRTSDPRDFLCRNLTTKR